MKLINFNLSLPKIITATKLSNGVDSTSQVIASAFLYASKTSGVQSKVLSNIDNIVTRHGRFVNRNTIAMMRNKKQTSNIISNASTISKLLNQFPNRVVSTKLSVKQSAIVAAADMYNLVADYCNTYLIEYVKSLGSKKHKLSIYDSYRPNLRMLRKYAPDFSKAVTYLSQNPDELLNSINTLPDITVDNKNANAVTHSNAFQLSGNPVDKLSSKFVGNPIYHIRMHLVEFEVYRYKKYRDEAQQLELLLLTLQSENNNPGVEREIEITEERIAVARRKMKAIYDDSNTNVDGDIML